MKFARLWFALTIAATSVFGIPQTASAATPTIAQLVTGANHTCVLLSDAAVQCWGEGGYGQLGGGDNQDSTEPIDVTDLTDVIQIAAGTTNTCAVTVTGAVYCWGFNQFGQLGDGTFTNSSTPVHVAGITTAQSVSLEERHVCALLKDATVKCWGENQYGQLGQNTGTNSSTPVPIANTGDVISVSVGARHTCAVLTGGKVECWGDGGLGQFGNGDSALILDPINHISLTPKATLITSGAVSVESGTFHTCALMTNGAVKCWGAATGIIPESTDRVLIPTEITGLNTIRQLSVARDRACAVDTNNVTRCWGMTYQWDGFGAFVAYPVQVPRTIAGLNPTSTVSTSGYHTCAVLTYGNVQCWGRGFRGQLGTTLNMNSEHPVGMTVYTAVPRVPYMVMKFLPTTITSTGVTYTWEKPDTDGLTIELYEITLLNPQLSGTEYTTTDESITFTGLTTGATYYARIRALTSAGWGDLTGWIENRTPSLPAPPTVASANPGGFGEISVEFTPKITSGMTPDKHRITWESSSSSTSGSAETSGTKYTISGLTPNESFTVKIYAHTDAGWGLGYTPLVTIAGGIPKPVINVAITNITENSMQISWAVDPTDYRPVTEFDVQYYSTNGGSKSAKTTETSITLTGLTANTNYSISIVAKSEYGWGYYSTSQDHKTAAPTTVPNKVSKLTGTPAAKKIKLTWIAPKNGGSPIIAYAVRYRLTGSLKFSKWIETGLNKTFTVIGLKKNKNYDFQIRATNTNGSSEGYVVKLKTTK